MPYELWTEVGCPLHYTWREEMRRDSRAEEKEVEAWYKLHPAIPYEKRKEI